MDIPEELTEIYDSWNPNSGGFQSACSECAVRDERGCRSPFYGHGTFNTRGEVDIMLIGESPGTASQEDGANPSVSGIRDFPEKQMEKISVAFGTNSPHIQPFVDDLQNKYDVYYTNLLKCNKLAVPTDGDSWMPAKILDEQSEPTTGHSDLNDRAKETCIDYLITEIFRLDPDVIIPFGGNAMVREVYDLFGMSVPKLKDAINNRETYEIKLTSENHPRAYSGSLVPSYHFSENRFKSRVSNIVDVSGKTVNEARDQYWNIIIQMVERQLT
jgi:uracil-DNA glycosylase